MGGGLAQVAALFTRLAGVANTHVTGQAIYIYVGSDAAM